jgi:hypothetical protein
MRILVGWMLGAALALGGSSMAHASDHLALGAQQNAGSGAVERARLVDVLNLDGEVFHVQGVDLDEKRIWLTSVDLQARKGYLHVFDRATGKLLQRMELTDGARYHPGGISIHGDSIWVPVAELKPRSSAVLVEIDRNSLSVLRRIPVADHLGCVAVSDHEIVAGNWDSRLLYVFDLQGRLLHVAPNPSATRYQDIKFVDGKLVGSGYLTPLSGTIDWLAWPSLKLLATRHAGATDRGKPYTGEGMALKGRELYLISEDGPSRLFHFRLTD